MKPIVRTLFILLFLCTSYASSYAQENQSYFLHTIEKGQSLYSISSMYNVTATEIIRLNPGCEEKIVTGQALKIPKRKTTRKSETFHTIRTGETLFKLTTLYAVSSKAICEANPGLSAENFRIGQVIRIPMEEGDSETTLQNVNRDKTSVQGPVQSRCKEMHRVKKKETIYSISREYGLTEQELKAANPELKDGLNKGQLLCIPYPQALGNAVLQPAKKEDTYDVPPTNSELFSKNKATPKTLSTIKAALVLPFLEDRKMVEYYEGFLMAVDSLKRMGISIDLHVYDCDKESSSLNAILAKSEMKEVNVIFGPMQTNHIQPLADFARKNEIPLVIPSASKVDEVFNNPYIYQINTPQSYLYSEVYEHFIRQFPSAHVVFIESNTDKEKAEFIAGLKQELKRKGVTMKSVDENASQEVLNAALRMDKTNLFIPVSGSNIVLIKVIPQLKMLVRDNPEADVHLFGYPEWQTYTKDHLDSFFELDTYFYSSFYTNDLLPAATRFTESYHRWYSKELVSKYPNYAMLGFDTGYFFLKGLSQYGTDLDENVQKISLTPIQTGFKFQRVNNWGGFVNKKAFFVHFTKNFELTKLNFE